MNLYTALREAVASGSAIDVEQTLGHVRPPPDEALCVALFDVVRSMGQEVAGPAAELLAAVRGGRGMPFLIEALALPVRNALQIVELLDFGHLGTGWGRVGRVLEALEARPRSRARFVERLIEQPHLVPPKRWSAIITSLHAGAELDHLLETFATLGEHLKAERRQSSHGASATLDAEDEDARESDALDDGDDEATAVPFARVAAAHRLMATALVERLGQHDDPPELQERISCLLVQIVPRLPLVGRRLMRLLGRARVCERNRAIVRAVRDDLALLARHHIGAAVPAFVGLVDCGDEELVACAFEALDRLAALGSPEEWYPLLALDSPRARALALRAIEQHPGDVSWALGRLLRSSDASLRQQAARTVGHRLLHGRSFGVDALQGYMRQIAGDPDEGVGERLDVASVIGLSSATGRFYATVELLRTRHASLLARVLPALDEPRVRASFLEAGPVELFVSALVDALVRQVFDGRSELAAHAARLLADSPLPIVVSDLDLVLGSLPAPVIVGVLGAFEALDAPQWLHARELFLRVHEGLADASQLRRLRDPRRAWLATAGLASSDPAAQLAALRAVHTLDNPTLLDHVTGLLGGPAYGLTTLGVSPEQLAAVELPAAQSRAVVESAMRLLLSTPHPQGLDTLRKRAAAAPDDALVARRVRELEQLLETSLAASPFSWPSPEPLPEDAVELRVWGRHAALHRPRQSTLRRMLGRPVRGTRALGRVTLSLQAWWQRDRRLDDVVLWEDAALELTREPLPASLGWDVLALTLRRFENFGTIECGVKLWVRSSPRTAKLPRARHDTTQHPFVHVDDLPAFLAWVRWLLEQSGARQSIELVESLSEPPPAS